MLKQSVPGNKNTSHQKGPQGDGNSATCELPLQDLQYTHALCSPRDPNNPSKMTKNIKEVTVEAIEN